MGSDAVSQMFLQSTSPHLIERIVREVRDSLLRHCSDHLGWTEAEIRSHRNPQWTSKGADLDWIASSPDRLARPELLIRVSGEKESFVLIREERGIWRLDADLFCDDLPEDLPGILLDPISNAECEEGFAYTVSGVGVEGIRFRDGLEICDLCDVPLDEPIESGEEAEETYRLSRCRACFKTPHQPVPALSDRMRSAREHLSQHKQK